MPESIARPAEAKSGFWAELDSFKSPESKSIANLPVVGGKAPSADKLRLPNGKDTLIVFLRHCGCPCEFFRVQYACGLRRELKCFHLHVYVMVNCTL